MGREKKNYESLNCKLDKEIAEMLSRFCEETGLSKTVTVERAVKMYVERYNQTKQI
jgi:predicted transcriptional regulator